MKQIPLPLSFSWNYEFSEVSAQSSHRSLIQLLHNNARQECENSRTRFYKNWEPRTSRNFVWEHASKEKRKKKAWTGISQTTFHSLVSIFTNRLTCTYIHTYILCRALNEVECTSISASISPPQRIKFLPRKIHRGARSIERYFATRGMDTHSSRCSQEIGRHTERKNEETNTRIS